MAAVLLVTSGPTFYGVLNGGATFAATIVYSLVFGIALAVAFSWMFYRPGRKLYRAMSQANPDMPVVPVYSSDELISGLKELNGSRLVSSDLPTGAYLVFVDAGRQFELWRSRRGGPERVVRLPWAAVESIEIDTISHLVITDRALVLNVKSGERTVRIPISPQERHAVRLSPVKDNAFNEFLTDLRSRVTQSQLAANVHRTESTVTPGSDVK
ncbi:hypothetical protein [Cryobacterium mannosilyticum]|uniref:Uncharacterized protein n=1 Tax=Cryobacterium mannosilyticum TaxID=1259190 RepID=A0A4R8WEP0_9MICO|nr:hypothetical protein [Cryobacterium mannosilyticum]TFC07986.1 hypothetical protein E3O32_00550 [Cryobacterium mannosilyticum]